jgi:rare lipoprotein A
MYRNRLPETRAQALFVRPYFSIYSSGENAMHRGLSLFLSTLFAVTGTANAEDGIASHYGRSSGSKVACGGELNESALTAAHRTLPCGARVRVENKRNGRSIMVTINDRGPHLKSRILDLTPAGARALDFSGLAHVSVRGEE